VGLPWYFRAVADPIDELIRRHGPEEVAAALRPLLREQRAERIESALSARLASVTAVLENLHDPHNGAAALRSIEALGLQHAHVVEAAESFSASPAITIGCEKWLTLGRHRSMEAAAEALRARGFALYAMLPGAERTVSDVDPARPAALVFGNEHEGLTDGAIGVCDDAISLPIYGFTQSFNLSVSVALALSVAAARRRAHLGEPGDLEPGERAWLRARWYALGMRGVETIVSRHVSAETQR
jgi:tRNA (guanosine-2'-O-)-methyltransferase